MLDGDSLSNLFVFILTTTTTTEQFSSALAMQLSLGAVTSSSLQSHLLQSTRRSTIWLHFPLQCRLNLWTGRACMHECNYQQAPECALLGCKMSGRAIWQPAADLTLPQQAARPKNSKSLPLTLKPVGFCRCSVRSRRQTCTRPLPHAPWSQCHLSGGYRTSNPLGAHFWM